MVATLNSFGFAHCVLLVCIQAGLLVQVDVVYAKQTQLCEITGHLCLKVLELMTVSIIFVFTKHFFQAIG